MARTGMAFVQMQASAVSNMWCGAGDGVQEHETDFGKVVEKISVLVSRRCCPDIELSAGCRTEDCVRGGHNQHWVKSECR